MTQVTTFDFPAVLARATERAAQRQAAREAAAAERAQQIETTASELLATVSLTDQQRTGLAEWLRYIAGQHPEITRDGCCADVGCLIAADLLMPADG